MHVIKIRTVTPESVPRGAEGIIIKSESPVTVPGAAARDFNLFPRNFLLIGLPLIL